MASCGRLAGIVILCIPSTTVNSSYIKYAVDGRCMPSNVFDAHRRRAAASVDIRAGSKEQPGSRSVRLIVDGVEQILVVHHACVCCCVIEAR